MSGCLMAHKIPCNPEYNGFLTSAAVSEVDRSAIITENRGWMTVCCIDAGPEGFLCCCISWLCQLVQLSLIYWVASFIIFVYSTLLCLHLDLSPEIIRHVMQWFPCFFYSFILFGFAPTFKSPKKLFPWNFLPLLICCVLGNRRKMLTVAGSD